MVRKKLEELAARASGYRILFIQAPAGYGKTVFAGQWLEQGDGPRAMITLDEYDNSSFDISRKLRDMLETLYPAYGPMLAFTGHPAFDSAPQEFLMRAAGALPREGRAHIAFDDLHFLTDSAAQRLFSLFLARLPDGVRILVLSRTAPPEQFSGFLLKNALFPVFQEQMCFSVEEIHTLYREHRIELTRRQAEDIFRYTEGWPIAVNALLLSGEHAPEKGKARVPLDSFLRTQVWDIWDEELRAFLTATALEEELTEPLCDRLTGRQNSRVMLERLLGMGAFLIREPDGVYRFHRLFREFLQQQLEGMPEEYRKRQYLLSGDYYLEKQDFYRAVERFSHTGDAGKLARCFDLLEQMERSAFDTERVMLAVRRYVTEETAEEYPFLYFMLAFTARNDGRVEEFKHYADRYYSGYSRVVQRNPELSHNIFFLYLMDFRCPLAEIARTAAQLDSVGFQGVRGTATSYFPLYHRSYRDLSELALCGVDEGIAEIDRALGSLLGAERAMLIDCIRAGLYYEKGELPKARELALAAAAKMEDGFAPESKFCVLMLLGEISCAMDLKEQREQTEQAVQQLIEEKKAFSLGPNFEAVLCRRRLSLGDAGAAQIWLEEHASSVSARVDFFGLYRAFTTARALIAEGNFDRASILLQKILSLCTAMNRPLDEIEAEILLAVSYWKKKRGSQQTALAYLEKAIAQAQPYGYEQVFVNEGAELETMLSRLKNRTVRSDYSGGLSGAFVKKLYIGASRRASRGKGLTGGRVEQGVRFTPQQKRVMELLCAGNSYRKIGELLNIRQSTVRSHIELIYKKLDVSGVKEAVIKIRELGVLEND